MTESERFHTAIFLEKENGERKRKQKNRSKNKREMLKECQKNLKESQTLLYPPSEWSCSLAYQRDAISFSFFHPFSCWFSLSLSFFLPPPFIYIRSLSLSLSLFLSCFSSSDPALCSVKLDWSCNSIFCAAGESPPPITSTPPPNVHTDTHTHRHTHALHLLQPFGHRDGSIGSNLGWRPNEIPCVTSLTSSYLIVLQLNRQRYHNQVGIYQSERAGRNRNDSGMILKQDAGERERERAREREYIPPHRHQIDWNLTGLIYKICGSWRCRQRCLILLHYDRAWRYFGVYGGHQRWWGAQDLSLHDRLDGKCNMTFGVLENLFICPPALCFSFRCGRGLLLEMDCMIGITLGPIKNYRDRFSWN